MLAMPEEEKEEEQMLSIAGFRRWSSFSDSMGWIQSHQYRVDKTPFRCLLPHFSFLISCPIFSHSILFILSDPFTPFYPISSYVAFSYLVLSYLISIISYPVFSNSFFSYLLSYPIISYPIQSCSILSFFIPSHPILSYPILSYPVLFYPGQVRRGKLSGVRLGEGRSPVESAK